MLAAVALLLLTAIGCGSAGQAPTVAADQKAANQPRQTTSANRVDRAEPPREEAAGPHGEAWQAHFIDGNQVGHAHLQWEPADDARVRITSESEVTIQRFGQTVTMRIELSSLETEQGQLVSCSSVLNDGTATTRTTARVEGDQLLLETKTPGSTQTDRIAWDRSWGGYFADLVSLRRQPMQPGEERTVHGFYPVLNRPAQYQLKAMDRETVQLLSGERELLRIDGSVRCGGVTIQTSVWTDSSGEPLKSITRTGVQEVAYRTTREIALRTTDGGSFDLGQRMLVPIERQIESPHQTRRVVYRVELDEADPVETFASGGTQTVERTGERTARVTVRAMRPEDPLSGPAGDPPGEADREPNSLIQSDDPRIVEMAKQASGGSKDPWEAARALERHVRNSVQARQFTQAMASASDVARSLEGDCTEHAVLLAALCRARQIPARVAIGLVYYGPAGGFAYHMWNEVWIQDRWIPLDGTLGAGGIGACHLKVTHSNLDGVSPYSALLPVVNVLGQLQLEIVSVE